MKGTMQSIVAGGVLVKGKEVVQMITAQLAVLAGRIGIRLSGLAQVHIFADRSALILATSVSI